MVAVIAGVFWSGDAEMGISGVINIAPSPPTSPPPILRQIFTQYATTTTHLSTVAVMRSYFYSQHHNNSQFIFTLVMKEIKHHSKI